MRNFCYSDNYIFHFASPERSLQSAVWLSSFPLQELKRFSERFFIRIQVSLSEFDMKNYPREFFQE